MTGSSISESRSQSCNGSICSGDEKASYVEGTPEKRTEKNSTNSSEKSGATYTKSDKKHSILRSSGEISNEKCVTKSRDPVPQRPISSLRLLSRDGILEPALLASKHAQWLAWNDPAFMRRRSIEEQRLCKRLATPTDEDKKSTVASFKRSLQLLGLKEADLGLNSVKCKRNEVKISRGRATPTFSTQLKQRSVSLTNLRNAVQESGLPTFQAIEKMHRDILTRAVYEEWYFRKQTESRIRKELEEEIQKKREQEIEWIKLERKQRAEENFEKWKKRKAQLQKEQQKEAAPKGAKPYAREKPGGDKAFEAWKAKKDEEIKAKANIKKKLEEEAKNKKDKEEKKAAAEAAFRAWKQQVDEELKNKLKEREREKRIAEEKKEHEEKEKRENAKACFMKWKKDKDKEIKESLQKKRSKSKQRAEEITSRKKEKEYEAAQAFEEWLDQVEEREDKRINTKKNSLKDDAPPWYPV